MTAAPLCKCCGKPRTRRSDNRGWTGYRGWCSACAERWRLAGKPPGGPPPRGTEKDRINRIRVTTRRQRLDRLTEYAFLVSFGEPPEQAAARAGVSARTARRVYDRMLAQQETAAKESEAAA